MKKVIVIAALLSGCAHNPIIDMQGVDANRYNADLQDCQATARVGAVVGAAGGAAHGAGNETDVVNRCLAGRGYRVLH